MKRNLSEEVNYIKKLLKKNLNSPKNQSYGLNPSHIHRKLFKRENIVECFLFHIY